jgi:hypothetical protein
MTEYAIAFQRLTEDISQLLAGLSFPSSSAVRAAIAATRDLEEAFDGAAGVPNDERWSTAIDSLDRFLDHCSASRGEQCSLALSKLRRFVAENADVAPPMPALQRAS